MGTKTAKNILFDLNANHINYALMRNFDSILNNRIYTEKDIDILAEAKHLAKIQKIMQNAGFKQLLLCPATGHYGFAKYVAGHFLSFHYHINGVAGSNLPYLDTAPVLQRKQQKNQLNIVSDEDLLLVLLLHSLLDGKKIKNRYKKEINRLLTKNLDWEYIEHTMALKLSAAIVRKILFYLACGNYKRIESIMPKIEHDFKYGRYYNILRLVKINAMKCLWSVWRLTKNAPLVSFIGIDGAGKTTMTHMLKEKLDHSLITNWLIYTGRGRNNLLPIQFFGAKYRQLGANKGKQIQNKNKKIKPDIRTSIIYTFAAPVFALDLFLRYWLSIWPKRKINQIVLTDRYSSDLLLMPNVSMIFKKILYACLPRPTLTIYLYNTPELLHKRKPNHSLSDLYRQMKIFAEINKKLKPIKIKSNIIEKTFDKICWQISNALAH